MLKKLLGCQAASLNTNKLIARPFHEVFYYQSRQRFLPITWNLTCSLLLLWLIINCIFITRAELTDLHAYKGKYKPLRSVLTTLVKSQFISQSIASWYICKKKVSFKKNKIWKTNTKFSNFWSVMIINTYIISTWTSNSSSTVASFHRMFLSSNYGDHWGSWVSYLSI